MLLIPHDEEVLKWCAVYLGIFMASFVVMPMVSPAYAKWSVIDQGFWNSSINSTVNALYVVKLTYDIGVAEGVGVFVYELPLMWSSEASGYLGRSLCGYLLADLLCLLYFNKSWKGWEMMVVHHVMGFYCFMGLMYFNMGHSMLLSSSAIEITNPIVNTRYFVDKLGMKNTHPNLYMVIGATMTVAFFFVRIIYFSNAGFSVLWTHRVELYNTEPAFKYMVWIGYAVGCSLQYTWFYKIGEGMVKLVGKSNKSSAKKVM